MMAHQVTVYFNDDTYNKINNFAGETFSQKINRAIDLAYDLQQTGSVPRDHIRKALDNLLTEVEGK